MHSYKSESKKRGESNSGKLKRFKKSLSEDKHQIGTAFGSNPAGKG